MPRSKNWRYGHSGSKRWQSPSQWWSKQCGISCLPEAPATKRKWVRKKQKRWSMLNPLLRLMIALFTQLQNDVIAWYDHPNTNVLKQSTGPQQSLKNIWNSSETLRKSRLRNFLRLSKARTSVCNHQTCSKVSENYVWKTYGWDVNFLHVGLKNSWSQVTFYLRNVPMSCHTTRNTCLHGHPLEQHMVSYWLHGRDGPIGLLHGTTIHGFILPLIYFSTPIGTMYC